jgi:hypothetical protein
MLVQWLTPLCLVAQPLPEGWWQHSSPESILAKAESVTHGLSYFQGSKAHLLTDRDASIESFQRKLPDEIIETKYMYHQGRTKFADYKLESGRYFSEYGRLIKCTFEDDQKERSLAAAMSNPYDYRMLKSEVIGTNPCLVVARVATPQFFEMLLTNYYSGYTAGGGRALGDLAQFIRSETDIYIRKSDGVIIGEIKRNRSGTIFSDMLYDVVQINNPIPKAEFELPNVHIEIATNTHQLLRITSEAMRAYNTPNLQAVRRIRYVIIGAMAFSLAALLTFLYFRFHREPSTSGGPR